MDVFFSHIDFLPLLYGLVIYVGLAIMWGKLARGQFLSVAIDVAVFYLVFKLHGHSMTGGFAATVAALLAGVTFPMIFRRLR